VLGEALVTLTDDTQEVDGTVRDPRQTGTRLHGRGVSTISSSGFRSRAGSSCDRAAMTGSSSSA
jgi:hypothetical protein